MKPELQCGASGPADVARTLTEDLVATCGPLIESVIAHGSWVHGDFCPGRSDLDLLVVLRQEPDARFLDVVRPILTRIRDARPDWRDRLEIGFITSRTVRAVLNREPTGGHVARVSPGETLHLVPADRHRLLDWDAAYHGRTLWGTQPSSALPPIPAEVVREVVGTHLRNWPTWLTESDATGFQAYAVLTVSRAAAYFATGSRHSKRAGAAWAAARLPEWRPLIEWALDWWYAGGSDDQQAPIGGREFVLYVSSGAAATDLMRPT